VSELLDVRVIGEPEVAETAVARVGELLDLDRLHGPYPSRKSPGLVRFYLIGRLSSPADPPALAGELERLDREAARLRAALELLTACQHGQGLNCPECEPVPDLGPPGPSGRGGEAGMTTTPTDAEIRLAEQYVRVLDFVSRCAQAIDVGNWHYLADKAAQLEDAASGLAQVARQTRQQVNAGQPRPRTEAVRAEVAHHGRHYRAGRLLHPIEPTPPGGERP